MELCQSLSEDPPMTQKLTEPDPSPSYRLGATQL